MSLSVTFPAKKFQLFQPIGGVIATFAAAVFSPAFACAPARPSPTTAKRMTRTTLPARLQSRILNISLEQFPRRLSFHPATCNLRQPPIRSDLNHILAAQADLE